MGFKLLKNANRKKIWGIQVLNNWDGACVTNKKTGFSLFLNNRRF